LAKKPVRAPLTRAVYPIEYYAPARQLDHAAVLFVDDVIDPTKHPEGASRKPPHFDIIKEASVLRLPV
jgi:hypothetical protein